jgi:hypothetical protein
MSQMRFFAQTIAEYTCTRHCGYHRSIGSANLSLFHIIAAATATLPLWLVSLRNPWNFPWYYLFYIFAVELLIVFLSGIVAGVLLGPFNVGGTRICKHCGAPMFFAGRHFDPKGSPKPHWSDVVIFGAFISTNIVIWCSLL